MAADLERAAQLLPHVVGVIFLGYHLVVADFAIWKQKVLRKQQEKGRNRDSR